jgi:hypothetical protein
LVYKLLLQSCLADFAPAESDEQSPYAPIAGAASVRQVKRPSKFAMPERLIGTVSSVSPGEGLRVISCSKLEEGVAAFDIHLAPEDALEGAVVAFYLDASGAPPLIERHAHAVSLEVLSRPSPANASRLGAAAAEGEATRGHKSSPTAREIYFKCFSLQSISQGPLC